MKLYRKIDNKGLFVEDVLLEEIPYIFDEEQKKIYDRNYIETPCPGGFYHPKWNGTKWIEGMSQEEIDAVKNRSIVKPLELRNRADIDYIAFMLEVSLDE